MCRGVFVAVMGVIVLLLILAIVMIIAGEPAVMAQPSAQPATGDAKAQQPTVQQGTATQPTQRRLGAAPPGTHGVPGPTPMLPRDQIEKEIQPEEREAMGLPEPTWIKKHGKVHPDVREVLKTGQMPWVRFKGYWPDAFDGYAYVAVYLRDKQGGEPTAGANQPTIKELQNRVLDRLTAAEFSTVYTFKNTAAFLGYVNPAGLAKLEKDADVTAIGLDDKPLPEPPPVAHGEERPPRPAGRVYRDVYRALEESGEDSVYVCVNLNLGAEWDGRGEEREAAARPMRDRVLSELTAAEFRLLGRTGGLLDGYINAAGLAKLDKHPNVLVVFLAPVIKPGFDHGHQQKAP